MDISRASEIYRIDQWIKTYDYFRRFSNNRLEELFLFIRKILYNENIKSKIIFRNFYNTSVLRIYILEKKIQTEI